MKILLNLYHPVIEDIAITLSKLGHQIVVSVNTDIQDHYGSWKDVLKNLNQEYNEFEVVSYKVALQQIKQKKFDLVGVDGVFDGDKQMMELCSAQHIPYFCINGYPGNFDEPSQNILSLGWSLPYIQYIQKYPQEHHRKMIDWKEIAENGRNSMKNICVFYPNFWRLKNNKPTGGCWGYVDDLEEDRLYLISGIQRFEECNPFNYKVFEYVKNKLKNDFIIENCEGIKHNNFIKKLCNSDGLLHLKQADQPGISVLEAMLLAKPIITMKSFVLASHNADLLIDGYNSIIADEVDELIERVQSENLTELGNNAFDTVMIMTDFDRQKNKLQRFLNRCVK